MVVLSPTLFRRRKRVRAVQIAAYETPLSLTDRPDVVDRHLDRHATSATLRDELGDDEDMVTQVVVFQRVPGEVAEGLAEHLEPLVNTCMPVVCLVPRHLVDSPRLDFRVEVLVDRV